MNVRSDGHLALEVSVYVDDDRPTAHLMELCWEAARKFSLECSHLGVQDAAQKRTSPSQTPGPWTGMVTHTDQGEVVEMVSQ